MFRMFIFGLAFIGNFAPALSDSLSPWFGGEGQEPFQVTLIEPATQISDITDSISSIEMDTNSTACLPDGCLKGANTAKTTVTIVEASQF